MVVLRPMVVDGLGGADVGTVAASKSHSAAVAGGQAWTWGEGREGKLGHGCTDNMFVPSRVESLVGRVDVQGVALGRHHTLFLDDNGKGQCGLGTPLQELAKQRRQEWDRGALAHWGASGPVEAAAGGGASAPQGAAAVSQQAQTQQAAGGVAVPAAQQAAAQQAQQQSYEQQQFERSVEYYSQHGWHTANLMPFLDHTSRAMEIEAAQQLFDERLRNQMASGRSAWQRFVSASGGELAIPGLAPGQIATPVPVGRDRQAMLSTAALFDPGLAAERAVSLAACRYFSAVGTASGQVWTFGGGFNGELGGGASWSSAARPVEGLVSQVIRDQGGAVRVVAGGSFCACLTASGRIVLWGQPRAGSSSGGSGFTGSGGSGSPVGAAGGGGESQEETLELPNMRARKQGGLIVAEFVDLPPMVDLAAGYSHMLMTDGSRVWSLGRHGPAGSPGTVVGDAEHWLQPREVLKLEDESVASVSAGGFASAAVTGAGRVYMWGTLLQKEAAESILERSSREGFGHWSYSSTAKPPSASPWEDWAGLHSLEPAVVPGLGGGVRQVALGTCHALAVVQ
ncbi:hypothetical protein N2152v2_010656 [Parachlorella kessleri]